MQRLQAFARGRNVREQLVHSVREEFEKTVREIEGGDHVTGSLVHWPKNKTLCVPVFLEERPHPLINTSAEPSLEESQKCNLPLPEVVSSLSPSPSSSPSSPSPSSPPSSPPSSLSHEDTLCDENGSDRQVTTPDVCPPQPQDPLNSASSLLVGGDLPEDREALMELGYQTAAELVWVKQAISSRQKYLQLKRQMRTQ